MTNANLAQEVAENNPIVDGYLQEDYSASKIAKIADMPTIMNEFYSTLVNVVAVQWAYDLLRGKTAFYSYFEKPTEQYGDSVMMIVPKGAQVVDYTTYTTPYDQSIPKTEFDESVLSTNVRWKVPLRLSLPIMRGAFLKEGGLRNVLGIMMKNIRDALNIKKYQEFTKDIVSSVTLEKVVDGITTTGETEKARKLYEEILYLTGKMTLPSTKYNQDGDLTQTPKDSFVVLWNARVQSSIRVNVIESLFHAKGIDLTEELVDFGEGNDSVQCIILDKEAYVNIPRFEETLMNINSATAEQIQFLHYWTRHGFIPWRQAVKLVSTATGESSTIVD